MHVRPDIREERDPDWWTAIASHPAVVGGVMGLRPDQVADTVDRPTIAPAVSQSVAALQNAFAIMAAKPGKQSGGVA